MFINTPAENESLEDVYYGKKEIMKIFHCENDKALRILRFLFYKNQTHHRAFHNDMSNLI